MIKYSASGGENYSGLRHHNNNSICTSHIVYIAKRNPANIGDTGFYKVGVAALYVNQTLKE